MTRAPDADLTHLRQIGWDEWDPIGIRQFNDEDWRADAADEYDGYLLHALVLLRNGAEAREAVEYLDFIASEHMGLGPVSDEGHAASERTVAAIIRYVRGHPESL
jgi:hypothetical protein